MNDRELLELAAKAAGIRINHWIYDDLDYSAAVLETGEVWHLLRYDLDAAGISNREKEALELVELRAENERLRGLLAEAQKAVWMNYDGDLLDRIEAALKEVPR